MTMIYISRHSEPISFNLLNYIDEEKQQYENERLVLSENGERIAKKLSECEEMQKIDVVFSSHYIRAISTAKYVAERNNLKININKQFGERIHGVDKWDNLPSDFGEKQFNDWDYKLENGESLNEVSKRMYNGLIDVLEKYSGKNILIVSHGMAFTCLLSMFCELNFNNGPNRLPGLYFNDKLIFDGKWSYCKTFKLEFDSDNKLINIENIKFDEVDSI